MTESMTAPGSPAAVEQLRQRARAAVAHRAPLVARGGGRVERLRGVPEAPQQRHPARVVPHRDGHGTAGLDDAGHLAHARGRVLHEVDDELGEGGVERGVGERERLGGAGADVGAREALRAGGGERRGGVDGGDQLGPARGRHERAGERARAAADVEHVVAGPHARGGDQLLRELGAVAADVPVVRLGGRQEPVLVAHAAQPLTTGRVMPGPGGDGRIRRRLSPRRGARRGGA